MGLQATSPPTSPLHRMPIEYHHAGLKRKHDNLEEDDLMPANNIESSHHTDEAKKIRVEVVCGHQQPNDQEQQPNGINGQENRVFPANNNTKELEKDKRFREAIQMA